MSSLKKSTSTKLKVYIRCRPMINQEISSQSCIRLIDNQRLSIGDKTFIFDEIFDEYCTQNKLYECAVKSLVDGCFQGFNATVFAYGQTGSGKTHSIIGPQYLSSDINKENDKEGIIPQSLRYIFNQVNSEENIGKVITIKVSFLEIYNEDLKDLLHPDIPSRDIAIREDKDGKIFVTSAREELVVTLQEAFKFLEKGNLARTTAETMMNSVSSRSHGIFTISLDIFVPAFEPNNNENNGNEDIKESIAGSFLQSKLHIVDLAGSERVKRTGANGLRLKESVGINQGLLSLGKVIRALTNPNNNSSNLLQHVPYRESKLTRYLQDSLGGNSLTVMLACVSQAEENIHETLNTLQYATRARSIQNKVTANISTAPLAVANNEVSNDITNEIIKSLKLQLNIANNELLNVKSDQSTNRQLNNSDSDIKLTNILREIKDTIAIISKSINGDSSSHNLLHMIYNKLNKVLSNYNNNLNILSRSLDNYDINKLKQELTECKEDLKRDEEIFAEKVKELKKCRQQIRQLQRENNDNKKLIDELNSINNTVTNNENKSNNFTNESISNNLEASLAVVANEPDISNLMEDLENITKDREKLLSDKLLSDVKFNETLQLLAEQRFKYSEEENRLQNQIDDLLQQLNERNTDLETLLMENKQLDHLINRKNEKLIELQLLVDDKNEEPLNKTISIDADTMKSQIKSLKQQQKQNSPIRPTSSSARDNNTDREKILKELEIKYKELNNKYIDESKHLNNKNSKLIKKLTYWSKIKDFSLDESINSDKLSNTINNHSVSPGKLNKSSSKKKYNSPIDIINRLNDTLDKYMKFKQLYLLVHKLIIKLSQIKNERIALINELTNLQTIHKNNAIKSNISKQITDIKSKLKHLITQINKLKNIDVANSNSSPPISSRSPSDNNPNYQDLSDRNSVNTQLSSLLREYHAYQHHYDELQSRLNSIDSNMNDTTNINVDFNEIENKMITIQEDIESIEIELQINEKQYNSLRSQLIDLIDNNFNINNNLKSFLLNELMNSDSKEENLSSTTKLLNIETVLDRTIDGLLSQDLNSILETVVSFSNDTWVDILKSLMISIIQSNSQSNQYRDTINELSNEVIRYNDILRSNEDNYNHVVNQYNNYKYESNEKIEYLLNQLKITETRVNNIILSNNSASENSQHNNDNVTSSNNQNKVDINMYNDLIKQLKIEKSSNQILNKKYSHMKNELKKIKNTDTPNPPNTNHSIDD